MGWGGMIDNQKYSGLHHRMHDSFLLTLLFVNLFEQLLIFSILQNIEMGSSQTSQATLPVDLENGRQQIGKQR